MAPKDPPAGLSPTAAQMWADITGRYALRFDELRILEDAMREMDLIDGMEKELTYSTDAGKWLVKGSMGQEVSHPLIGELARHRSLLSQLLGKLKLPDEDAGAPMNRSAAGRALVNARWNKSS